MQRNDSKAGERPMVLIVDDEAIIRDPIRECVEGAGYEAVAAGSAAEALQIMEEHTPGLVVLDLRMPNMDGLALLSVMRMRSATANTPVILLTVERDKAVVVQARKLGVRDYVLKARFGLRELLERIGRLLPLALAEAAGSPGDACAATPHAAAIPRICTSEEIMGRAEKALRGRTLSGAVTQVISMASSPRASNAELAALISRDAILSANVLRVANSAAYASAKGLVTTIPDAIRNIGCAAVARIAAAVAVIDSLPESLSDGFNPVRAWQHSFAVAHLCQLLAPEGDATGGVPYLVGLCHDVTDMLFRARFANEHQQVLAAQQRTGKPQSEVEQAMLGTTLAKLAPLVLRQMGLPETISAPIIAFHNAVAEGLPPTEPLARLLWLADFYANGMLLASSTAGLVGPLTHAMCMKATGNPNPKTPDPTALRSEVFALTAVLAHLSTREDAVLAAPLLPRSEARLWLARNSSFSTFDPIAAALGSLAEVRVATELPTPRDGEQFDGLVVLGCNSQGSHCPTEAELKVAPSGRAGLPPLLLSTAPFHSPLFKAVQVPATLETLRMFIHVLETRSAQRAA